MTTFAPIETQYADPVDPGGAQGPIERVRQRDVRFLCFEGGGGKGVIFLGALKALEQRNVLRFQNGRLIPGGQIEGIAGSSAGALTAVLLSCGYNQRDIHGIIFDGYNFNRFFDQPARPAARPTPLGCVSDDHGPHLPIYLRALASIPASGSRDDGFGSKLASRRLVHYLLNLVRHMGVFSGCEAHRFFDFLIANKANALQGGGNWQRFSNMTFEQHYRLFRIKLVLTGSNFETGKSAFFSADTCPNMPVAAAARISMSLPLIFKPMRISASEARRYGNSSGHPRAISPRALQGVWVDGGYMNNLPQTAFSHEPNGRRRTLGLSLQEYQHGRKRIRSLGDFLKAYALLGVFGTGESHDSASTGVSDDRVALMTGDRQFQLDTTDFAITREQRPHVDRLIRMAAQSTLRYFDRP